MEMEWSSPEGVPALAAGGVQVWRLLGDAGGESLRQVLSADELERAERMRAGGPREEFVRARGLLRVLLGAAVGEAADGLRFAVGAYGKPRLEGGAGVEFNVTHARGCVLVAVSRAGAVGVDAEPLDRAVEALELARAHFHADEVARLEEEVDEVRRLHLFFRCWTRKEAVVKADGRGLQVGLDAFCVLERDAQSVDRGATQRVLLRGGREIQVQDLFLGHGYAAALALTQWGGPLDFHDAAALVGSPGPVGSFE